MKTLWNFLTVSTLLLAGCQMNSIHPDLVAPSAPTGLSTSTGDNFIELFWNANTEGDFAGYNVFVSDAYNGAYRLIGSAGSPYFLDNGAVNGKTYYYAVTAYDMDGNESPLSKDVAYDVPRPEGYDVVLNDYRTNPGTAGYSFATYSIGAYDATATDIFFENYRGALYMDVYTDTDIQDMGTTNSIVDISTAPASGWSTTHDVLLSVGHTYVVWTVDDHYAKFRVTALSPGRVVFDWAYQLQKSNPMLKRPARTGDRSRVTHEVHMH